MIHHLIRFFEPCSNSDRLCNSLWSGHFNRVVSTDLVDDLRCWIDSSFKCLAPYLKSHKILKDFILLFSGISSHTLHTRKDLFVDNA